MPKAQREFLRNYYSRPKPVLAIFLLIAGVAGIILGQSSPRYAVLGVAGAAAAIIGGIWLGSRLWKHSMTDEEVDELFQLDIGKIVNRSVDKVGLRGQLGERKSLHIAGPILWATNGVPNKDLLWRKGKDKVVRFAVNRVTVIHLSDHLLAAYSCDFNSLKDVTLNEATQEYHYRDIVSVSTQEDSTSYTLPSGTKLVNAQAFRISVSSGESVKVVISADKLTKITQGTIPTSGAEDAVRAIRVMLREKKQ